MGAMVGEGSGLMRVRKTSSVFRLHASSEGVVAGLSGQQNVPPLDEL